MLDGLLHDGSISSGTLTTISVITIDRLMLYFRSYDECYGEYPEHSYEAEHVRNWILECALSDGFIGKEEFDKHFTGLNY